jgi:CheY-specific phosphatase CheX
MSSTMVQSLAQATTATFEELAMLFPESDLSPEQSAAPLDIAAAVEFRGPTSGRLVLQASSVILADVANNMLGADDSRPPALQRDALGELANVICGHVLPLVGGADAVFHLSAPTLYGSGELPTREHDRPAASVEVGVEQGRAVATLFLFDARRGTPSRALAAVA